MDGLTVGRMVHYVCPNGAHRAAIVIDIDRLADNVDLFVFAMPQDECGGFFMRTDAEFSQEPKEQTWHWIEKA